MARMTARVDRVAAGEKRGGGAPSELLARIKAGGKPARAARASILHAMMTAEGKPEVAAEMLGVSYETLARILRRLPDLAAEAYAIRMRAREAARAQKAKKK